jgi:hypothetical protein
LGEKPINIRNENNVLDIYSHGEIRDFVFEYLEQENKMDVFDAMISYSGYQKVIDGLEINKELEFFKADKKTRYFFFNNGVVKITKDEISNSTFESIESQGCLWRKNRSSFFNGQTLIQSKAFRNLSVIGNVVENPMISVRKFGVFSEVYRK